MVEGPETFEVGGSSALGDSQGGHVLTIVDDDDADIDLSWSLSSVEEQSGAQSVTVTASFKGATSILAAATPVSVTVAGAGGATLGSSCPTGTGDDACTSLTNNAVSISIPAGSTSASETFMVTVPDDSASESGEKLTVSGDGDGGGVGGERLRRRICRLWMRVRGWICRFMSRRAGILCWRGWWRMGVRSRCG